MAGPSNRSPIPSVLPREPLDAPSASDTVLEVENDSQLESPATHEKPVIDTPPTTTREARRAPRRWVPYVVSGGLHLVALGAALIAFAPASKAKPEKRLALSRVEFVEPFQEDAAEVEVSHEPPAELEIELPPEILDPDAMEEPNDLPAFDCQTPDCEPLQNHEVSLDSVKVKVKPTEPAPQPRKPVARPAAPRPTVARPVAKRTKKRGRPLKLVSRPNLMQYYPVEARRRGIEGEAVIEIRVDTRGVVIDAKVVRSSGSALLDKQAVRVMYDYRFAAGDGGRARVPVNFRLR